MKTYTQQSDSMPADYEPRVVTGKTVKECREKACAMLSVSGPRGLKFSAEDGSGFVVSLYDGQDYSWDKNGRRRS